MIHAIGDRATEVAVNAMADVLIDPEDTTAAGASNTSNMLIWPPWTLQLPEASLAAAVTGSR